MNGTALGVIFHPAFPPETLPDYARRAEAAGFDELWLWDDCFLPGALTSAAVALAATQRLKVGIGLMPVTAYNPVFAAMEITTLARAFPGRFMPGFGHGVGFWMKQIGAAAPSSLKAVEETVDAVRRLLRAEMVTVKGTQVNLDQVQMQLTPNEVPPLYIGAVRRRTLQLAGRVSDGVILTSMSSPAYVRWALGSIRQGMDTAGRSRPRVVVNLDAKVHPEGEAARRAMRKALVERLPWPGIVLDLLGIQADYDRFFEEHTPEEAAEQLPDAWLDALSAAGTPEQAAASVRRLVETGVDSIVLQPLNGDPACLDEYIRYLMPVL